MNDTLPFHSEDGYTGYDQSCKLCWEGGSMSRVSGCHVTLIRGHDNVLRELVDMLEVEWRRKCPVLKTESNANVVCRRDAKQSRWKQKTVTSEDAAGTYIYGRIFTGRFPPNIVEIFRQTDVLFSRQSDTLIAIWLAVPLIRGELQRDTRARKSLISPIN